MLCPAAEEEFEDLCFEYGIELDDVVSLSMLPSLLLTLSVSSNSLEILLEAVQPWMMQKAPKGVAGRLISH